MRSTYSIIFGAFVFLIFYTAQSSAILCYSCNSYHDATCGDPFRQTLNDSTSLVNCDTLNDGQNYTFCRKTIQTASQRPEKDTVRVIRSCGFLDEPKLALDEGDDPMELKCFRRLGTFAVENLYCACYADGCNSANTNIAGIGMLLVFSIIASAFSINM